LATELLEQFQGKYESAYNALCQKKLGLPSAEIAAQHNRDLLSLMREARADFTLTYRTLTDCVDHGDFAPLLEMLPGQESAANWNQIYRQAFVSDTDMRATRLECMKRTNPVYIPRNHQVEAALTAAQTGDLKPFSRLLSVVQTPFAPPDASSDPSLMD